ncbi:helix-turn-helix transcriptional regulator [uncultured Clostridium sp.]|uniref:helix-turn-helix transcriptional regulator n=1 Tax=uncultured Clostridium sp. TaxID=59620 RepID=UPI0025D83A50|nr:helix-turn-helix transcriptional regulator [uncultured Clostridium sp.]
MKRIRFKFRFSGMFGQTLLVLMAVTIVIGTFFAYFLGNLYEEQYLEKQSDVCFANMKERSLEADKAAASLTAKMESLLQAQDCSRLMVSGKNLLQQQAMNVVQELSNLVDRDEDVTEAYLYLPYSEKVLGSDKSVVNSENFSRQELLDVKGGAAGNGNLPGAMKTGGFGNGFFCLDGEGWMIMDYPDAKTLARVILRLNLPEIYRKMELAAEQTTGGGMIYVYDSRGIPVFSGMLAYPGQERLMVSEQEQTGDGKGIYRSGEGYILVYQSDRTGWYFIQHMDGIHLDVEAPSLVRALVTYGLFALVLLTVASFYLIWRIYRPFRALLESLISQKHQGGRMGNGGVSATEQELLRGIVKEDREQNERLKAILQSVGASLSEHLFKQLMTGKSWDENAVRQTLEQIQSPFPLDGSYRVLALTYRSREHGGESPVDGELYGLQVIRCSEEYWGKAALVQPVDMEEQGLGIVLCMKTAMTETTWYRELERFEKSLRRRLAERGFEVAAGGSDLAGTLFDLNVLWLQAQADLEQRMDRARPENPGVQMLGRLLKGDNGKKEQEGNREVHTRVERAKELIKDGYGDSSLSLESISEKLGLTAPYLSRIFAEHQPPGFLDYLNRYRLEQAKDVLRETDETIGDIGFRVGFNSPQSFIRVFKRYEGETPGQYRARIKEGGDA